MLTLHVRSPGERQYLVGHNIDTLRDECNNKIELAMVVQMMLLQHLIHPTLDLSVWTTIEW